EIINKMLNYESMIMFVTISVSSTSFVYGLASFTSPYIEIIFEALTGFFREYFYSYLLRETSKMIQKSQPYSKVDLSRIQPLILSIFCAVFYNFSIVATLIFNKYVALKGTTPEKSLIKLFIPPPIQLNQNSKIRAPSKNNYQKLIYDKKTITADTDEPETNNSIHEQLIKSINNQPFKNPLKGYNSSTRSNKQLGIKRESSKIISKLPLHDPHADDALVLYWPPVISKHDKLAKSGQESESNVHIVVDPKLQQYLRRHQREGVKFMFDCCFLSTILDKNQDQDGFQLKGCILADEMGLGKSLQCLTLAWTSIKQSHFGSRRALVSKIVITCPASLVKNWQNEFQKWLQNSLSLTVIESGSSTKIDSLI
ncbi:MAG: DNA repair and recombination protein RAD54-like, partial [Paramarteilia canceri]